MNRADLDKQIANAAATAAVAGSNGDDDAWREWSERATCLMDLRDRLDAYTQEQHQAGINAARDRALAKRAARRERAREAAARLSFYARPAT